MKRPAWTLRTLLALAPLALVGCSDAVHGIVRDKVTGQPISGAGVTVGELNATTSATGVFEAGRTSSA